MNDRTNESHELKRFDGAAPDEIEDAMERGEVVFFERCPIELPPEPELELMRSFGTGTLRAKNISYHPESDSVPRFEARADVKARVEEILRAQGRRVEQFLSRTVPDFVPGWSLGTTSFRPIEERGRGLEPRSSNELVHIDAGAYGATNGARILRFFVNVHPTRDRVWGTKGSFHDLMSKHEALWQAARGNRGRVKLSRGPFNELYSTALRRLGGVYPLVRVIDSSPYDRSMRRVHNFMKEDPQFRDSREDYRQIRFPPMSAWMVFTDGVSHSVLEGQHAFVTTALVPLENCRMPELAPYHVLAADGQAGVFRSDDANRRQRG